MPRFLAASLITIAALSAADQPLGQVESSDTNGVVIAFDAGARVNPGTVVAIYGPGKVEKHPLTKEVMIEQRRLIAKAQVTVVQGSKVIARVATALGSAAIEKGMDVVPLPNDAAPNSPPVVGTLAPLSTPAQTAVRIALPVTDPDGDALSITWSLSGSSGPLGRLAARTTSIPEVVWYAPGTPGASGTITAVVRDRTGQETTVALPVQVTKADDDLRKRKPATFQRYGEERKPTRLDRDASGRWWALDAGHANAPVRFAPGWLTEDGFKILEPPRQPVAFALFKSDTYVVDAASNSAGVFASDGARRRAIGGLERPTDVVVDGNGIVYVADQGIGGVAVYETDGRFRARLGRAGKGPDGFVGLTRLAIAPNGGLVCLDAEQRMVARYDRFQQRLESWEFQGDAKDRPVDIAVTPRGGVLVLLSTGRILVFDDKGVAGKSLPDLGASGLVKEDGAADSLFVDASGECYVAYSSAGLILRYGIDGKPNGVRGGHLLAGSIACAASDGRMFALNEDRDAVLVFDPEGWMVARVGNLGKSPVAIAVGNQAGVPRWLYVLDQGRCNVLRFNVANLSEKPAPFASEGKNPGQLSEPTCVAADDAGRCYVLDPDLGRVSVFDSDGKCRITFGSLGKGTGQFKDPRLLAVSPAGDACYVYDYDVFQVKKFTLDYEASRGNPAGSGGGKGDGPVQLRKLMGMGCDRFGLLYLADGSRGDVQVIDFRDNNPVMLQTWKFDALDRKEASAMTVSPDGQVWLADETGISGTSW